MPRSEGSARTTVPVGVRVFQVYEIGQEVPTAKSHYRVWKFNTSFNGETAQVWQNLFPWEEVPLLESLGYKQDEMGGIDWEIEDLQGKTFRAEVYHEDYKGKTYAKVKNFAVSTEGDKDSDSIPF